jgi:two-component system, cell cycle response regulator
VENLRVCVADDDRDVAEILIQGLVNNGYSAFAVHTGQEALDTCTAGEADLLLLDVGLPDIDGYEVCTRLREQASTVELPIIFVTVRGADADVRRGFSMGAADYIVKPYNLPMVMLRIDAVLRTKQVAGTLRMYPAPIYDTVYTDNLTGLRNRRYLLERLQEEVERAHRFGQPVACVLIDIDEFVPLDYDFGVAPLDDLLAEAAMTLRNASRNYDVLARYDGAIFATVLPHSELEQALAYARKMREEMDGVTFSDPNCPTQAGVSIGVVTCRNGKASDAEHLLGEAMRHLLRAKSLPGERIASCDLNA